MSYYSSSKNICPGVIEGSALDGLRHRVAICVRRVLDSSKKNITKENTTIFLSNINPELKPPFVFISATTSQVEAIVRDLIIKKIDDRSCFARVRCKIIIPLDIVFEDDRGERGRATSQICIDEDIIMFVPQASIFPFEVVASASVTCTNGIFESSDSLRVTACITLITKVVAQTDLLIPSYGFCPSPRAVDFREEVCNDFFDLPLYPSGR